jgi:hypothetical protein
MELSANALAYFSYKNIFMASGAELEYLNGKAMSSCLTGPMLKLFTYASYEVCNKVECLFLAGISSLVK